jgi:hypothetical protein
MFDQDKRRSRPADRFPAIRPTVRLDRLGSVESAATVYPHRDDRARITARKLLPWRLARMFVSEAVPRTM